MTPPSGSVGDCRWWAQRGLLDLPPTILCQTGLICVEGTCVEEITAPINAGAPQLRLSNYLSQGEQTVGAMCLMATSADR